MCVFGGIPRVAPPPKKRRSGERLLGICGAGLLGYLRPFLEFLKNGRHRGNQVGLGGKEKHTRRFHCSKVYIKCTCVIHPMKQHSMYCYLLNFSLMIYIILSQLMHLWLEELLPHFSIVDMSQTSSCLAGNRPHISHSLGFIPSFPIKQLKLRTALQASAKNSANLVFPFLQFCRRGQQSLDTHVVKTAKPRTQKALVESSDRQLRMHS